VLEESGVTDMRKHERIAGARAIVGGCVLAVLAGCASMETDRAREVRGQRAAQSINLDGFPPEYRSAFAEGCAAVGVAGAKPPAGEPLVVQGWRDGQRHCARR